MASRGPFLRLVDLCPFRTLFDPASGSLTASRTAPTRAL